MVDKAEEPKVDLALVVVHGIGQQAARQTLYSWAEPLAAELAAVLRSRGSSLRIESVTDDSDSGGRIVLTTGAGFPPRRIAITEARWADSFLTASNSEVVRWALGFAPRAVMRAVRHTWRSARLAIEGARTVGDEGVSLIKGSVNVAGPGHGSLNHVVPTGLAMVVGGLFVAAGVLAGLALLLIALPVILLVFALALVLVLAASYLPVVGRYTRPILLALNSSIGDASVWTSRPVRAAAMRDTVRKEIRHARASADKVVLLGHSQGAAVCVAACCGEGQEPVDVLVTVGGAVDLLGVTGLAGATALTASTAVGSNGKQRMRWINAWATWDFVPSGPVGSSAAAARRRWLATHRAALAIESLERIQAQDTGAEATSTPRTGGFAGAALDFLNMQPRSRVPGQLWQSDLGMAVAKASGEPLVSDELAQQEMDDALEAAARSTAELHAILAQPPDDPGPEEWPLHNRSSLITDHVTYTSNADQLLGRLALLLLDPAHQFVVTQLPEPGTEGRAQFDREARHTSRVRSLAVYRLTCWPSGALLAMAFLGQTLSQALVQATEWAGGLTGIWAWVWSISSYGDLRARALFTLASLLLALGLMSVTSVLARWTVSRRLPWTIAFVPGACVVGLAAATLWNSPWLALALSAVALAIPYLGHNPSPYAAVAQSPAWAPAPSGSE